MRGDQSSSCGVREKPEEGGDIPPEGSDQKVICEQSHKQTVCGVGDEATAARSLKEARDKQQSGQCSRFLLEREPDSALKMRALTCTDCRRSKLQNKKPAREGLKGRCDLNSKKLNNSTKEQEMEGIRGAPTEPHCSWGHFISYFCDE